MYELSKNSSFKEFCISYFDENKEIISFSDASPYGISSVLLQQGKDHALNVISYNPRFLIEIEKKYPETER